MGQEFKASGHKIFNLDDSREVQYWTHRLGITKTELKHLAEAMDQRAIPPHAIPQKPTVKLRP